MLDVLVEVIVTQDIWSSIRDYELYLISSKHGLNILDRLLTGNVSLYYGDALDWCHFKQIH